MYLTPELFARAGADLANPAPSTFPKAFSYCDVIPNTKQFLRDACFGGFGKEFIPLAGSRDIRKVEMFTDAQYTNAISWCELAGVPDGVSACISHAVASIFWGGENDPDAGFRFCSLAVDQSQDACYKAFGGEIARYTKGDTYVELCKKFPEKFAHYCAIDSKNL